MTIRHTHKLARKELIHLICVLSVHIERVKGVVPVELSNYLCVVAELVFSPIDHHSVVGQCVMSAI